LAQTHIYRSQLSWQGSTADGYESYDRSHRVALPPAHNDILLSADPTFLGQAELANPEQLLLAAASSCQLLSLLALAARARVEVLAYRDEAEAIMPEDARPMPIMPEDARPMRITRVTLRPRITVAPGTDAARLARLIKRAHEECFIANTLNAEIVVEPVVEHADGSTPTASEPLRA
jgi:organic hydroperoxide reductase OsmC/OhrA